VKPKVGREVPPVGLELLKRREAASKQRKAERNAAKERGKTFPPWTPDDMACLPPGVPASRGGRRR